MVPEFTDTDTDNYTDVDNYDVWDEFREPKMHKVCIKARPLVMVGR